MRLFYLLFFLGSSISLFGQTEEIFVDGNKWYHRWFAGFTGGSGTNIYTVDGDTIVDGLEYKKVFVSRDSLETERNLISLVRQSNDSIFQIFRYATEPRFQQRLPQNLNDTIIDYSWSDNGCPAYVYEIDTVPLFNGEQRARYRMRSTEESGWDDVDFISGIGYTSVALLGFVEVVCSTDGGSSLSCFYQEDELVYRSSSNRPCFFFSSSQELLQEKVTVFPNPTNDFLQVDLSSIPVRFSNLRILNVLGEIVSQHSNPQGLVQIEVGHLPKGAYLLQLRSRQNKMVTKQFVVN